MSRKRPGGSIVGVLIYYGFLAVGLWATFRWVPGWAEIFAGSRLAQLSSTSFSDALSGPSTAVVTDWPTATMAMVGALVVVIPVAWVYVITKRGQDYDPSVVQTMIILPVAVSGIVLIVQSSIALAFSLAGIVAAVRFRNTLKDTKDAVYVFVAIGVGLAAGVQAFGVTLVMSIVFNVVVLVLWRFNVGHIYDLQAAAVPADAQLDTSGEDKPFQGVLRIHTADLEEAGPVVDSVLNDSVKRWRRAAETPTTGSAGVLDYYVRFKKKTPPKDVLTKLQQRGIDLQLTADFDSFAD